MRLFFDRRRERMMYNDYTKAVNIAHDWIRWPCARVSSAEIPSFMNGAPFGRWYETWVFSDCPNIKTKQKIFRSKDKCLRAHGHILHNMKQQIREM